MERFFEAAGYGIAAFFVLMIGGCGLLMIPVRNSSDGQAGMGAAFGGLYLGAIGGLLTFLWFLCRNESKP